MVGPLRDLNRQTVIIRMDGCFSCSLHEARQAAFDPKASLSQHPAGAQAAIWSSTRRPPFDNAKSRLTTCKRHVVGNHRLSEALEGQRANLFGYDASP